jgi:hypothetical protein
MDPSRRRWTWSKRPAVLNQLVRYEPIVGLISERPGGHLLDAGRCRHCRTYFCPPVHLMPVYEGMLRADDLSWTEWLSRSALCLPLHAGGSPDTARRIADIVRSFGRAS